MVEIIKKIITNVLTVFYEPFGFAIVLTILFMFFYMYAREKGLKSAIKQWIHEFKTDICFRKMLLLVFYTAMILFFTLLNRNLWANPISDVMGGWGLYDTTGELTTEAIENLVLFIPFIILLFWNYKDRILKENNGLINTLLQASKIAFLFSVAIEFAQLLLRLGTFQLSDLVYNTVSGLLGGLIWWICYKIKR